MWLPLVLISVPSAPMPGEAESQRFKAAFERGEKHFQVGDDDCRRGTIGRTRRRLAPPPPIPVKVADGDGLAPTAQPEFEVCRAVAEQRGVPLRVVQQAALAAWWGRAPTP